jgi:hypothetical protein
VCVVLRINSRRGQTGMGQLNSAGAGGGGVPLVSFSAGQNSAKSLTFHGSRDLVPRGTKATHEMQSVAISAIGTACFQSGISPIIQGPHRSGKVLEPCPYRLQYCTVFECPSRAYLSVPFRRCTMDPSVALNLARGTLTLAFVMDGGLCLTLMTT